MVTRRTLLYYICNSIINFNLLMWTKSVFAPNMFIGAYSLFGFKTVWHGVKIKLSVWQRTSTCLKTFQENIKKNLYNLTKVY